MGLAGKVGATIAGVGPMMATTVTTIMEVFRMKKVHNANIPTLMNWGLQYWMNTAAEAYGFDRIFKDQIDVVRADGSSFKGEVKSGLPKGSAWPIIGVGLTQVLVDRVVSLINHNRGVNIPGTKIRAIGS